MIDLQGYEKLKNNLFSLCSGTPLKTIMVSNSVQGEGCSTVASNLARILGMNSSQKILLIDANFRRPTLHKSFKIKNELGLSDLLLNDVEIDDVLKESDLPNLMFIPNGRNCDNPVETLETLQSSSLIKQLKSRFDYLIFDSASVSSHPDALILAPHMDGVILVVCSGKTRWEVARRTKEQLEMAKANIIGVLLNRKKYYIPKFIYNRLK